MQCFTVVKCFWELNSDVARNVVQAGTIMRTLTRYLVLLSGA
jgi:hypothetical protein